MEYLDELICINQRKYKIAKTSKCKKLGCASRYLWLNGVSVVLIVFIGTFLMVFDISKSYEDTTTKERIVVSLIISALPSAFIFLMLLPLIILSLINNIKLKKLLKEGSITAGLIINSKAVGQNIKNRRQKYCIKYVYLNGVNQPIIKKTYAFVGINNNLKNGRRVLVAFTDKKSEILADFLLQDMQEIIDTAVNPKIIKNTETKGESINHSLQSKNIIGADYHSSKKEAIALIFVGIFLFIVVSIFFVLILVKVQDFFFTKILLSFLPIMCLFIIVIGFISLIKEKNIRLNEENLLTGCIVTNAEIVTTHIYKENTEGFTYYYFNDKDGKRQLSKRIIHYKYVLPDQVFVAYNPNSPKENILVSV